VSAPGRDVVMASTEGKKKKNEKIQPGAYVLQARVLSILSHLIQDLVKQTSDDKMIQITVRIDSKDCKDSNTVFDCLKVSFSLQFGNYR
jgi:hypothetical protein